MDFWRSGSSRSSRPRAVTTVKGPQGVVQRLRHMYFPPWLPVVGIIFVVFGILGLLFITRSATGSPRIGSDHWHATYTFYACGDKQPNAATWESGVHTHQDGIIHIHPFSPFEEGAGARLEKWFEYGSGKLDNDEIRLPSLSKTWKNGEVCPEGTPDAGKEGVVQIFVNSQKLDDWSRLIPKDGDRIQMIFGPEEAFIQLSDRIVLEEENATREIEITVDGNEDTTAFTPGVLQMKVGETVKIILKNPATVSHGLRFAGSDGEYETGDDFVAVPVGSDPEKADQGDIIEPGGEGFVIVRFDDPGQLQFKDPTANAPVAPGEEQQPYAVGSVLVGEGASATPIPDDEAEQEVTITTKDDAFEPAEVTVEEGKSFKFVIKNDDPVAHNLRIDGPDGEFETDDDIVSEDVDAGTEGSLIVGEDRLEAGAYQIRDDYKPDMTGTLTVE